MRRNAGHRSQQQPPPTGTPDTEAEMAHTPQRGGADTPRGPSWWVGDDGRWYPPQSVTDVELRHLAEDANRAFTQIRNDIRSIKNVVSFLGALALLSLAAVLLSLIGTVSR